MVNVSIFRRQLISSLDIEIGTVKSNLENVNQGINDQGFFTFYLTSLTIMLRFEGFPFRSQLGELFIFPLTSLL